VAHVLGIFYIFFKQEKDQTMLLQRVIKLIFRPCWVHFRCGQRVESWREPNWVLVDKRGTMVLTNLEMSELPDVGTQVNEMKFISVSRSTNINSL